MMLHRSIAYCQNCNSFESGQAAAEQIQQQLRGILPDVLMLFVTIQHDLEQLLNGIRSRFADVPIVGCTGLGVITKEGCDHASHSIALMGLKSEQVQFHPFLFSGLSQNANQVGQQIGQVLVKAEAQADDRQLLFYFMIPSRQIAPVSLQE